MKKITEDDILMRLKVWRSSAIVYLLGSECGEPVVILADEFWTKRDDRAYKRIVELIKIFFAKEVSSGPIKEDISRPVLTEWLEGINQAATAVKDHYVMKATTQLIAMLSETEKARLIWDATCPEIPPYWLPSAENINALPEPVRNYVSGLETNADPPSMVADNIIMKDTIKTLEKMLEERPAVDEGFVNTWANEFATATLANKIMHRRVKYMLKEAGVEVLKDKR